MAKPTQACFTAVAEQMGDKLTPDELKQAFERVEALRNRLEAEGRADRINERLAELVDREAEKTEIAAALARKHAALNVIVRDRREAHLRTLLAAGLRPDRAILAMIEGTTTGAAGGRVSVWRARQAYEGRYLWQMLGSVLTERPHVQALLKRKDFNEQVVREMYELRDGGTPGKTGDDDAAFVAERFARYAELSRTDLNALGAAIGKLDGWAGPQMHNDRKILRAGRETWKRTIRGLLDLDRSFPDVATPAELDSVLDDIFVAITTGQDRGISAVQRGEKVGPASLAKSLGKSRVLHFRDADAWIAYNKDFGQGDLFQAMVKHQQHAASAAAQMEFFGPNPEVMLGGILGDLQQRVMADPAITDTKRAEIVQKLGFGVPGLRSSAIANAFFEMQGFTLAPSSTKWAGIAATIRNQQTMAKMGGASLASFFTDPFIAALASAARGSGFVKGFTRQLGAMLANRSAPEARELQFLLGEGFDGFIGNVVTPYLAQDGVPGAMHKGTTLLFRLNGLTWFTDRMRGAAARVISAELAMRTAKAWDALPPRYRSVLEAHGFTPAKWQAVQAIQHRSVNGKAYVTPDLAEAIPDDALAAMVEPRMATFSGKSPDAARARYQRQAREELRRDLAGFFADETSFAIIEPDARSRRWTVQGTRPGTFAGEILRFMTQFKGFTFAFTSRTMGRAIYGGAGKTTGERLMNNAGHLGLMLAVLTAAGYATVALKDTIKGNWPPRDLADTDVLLAALMQGGAAGIYGDFLFGEANRWGNTPLETLAGPAAGSASKLLESFAMAIRGESRGIDWLNNFVQNTPFANLFYARPALDTLFLNAWRESLSPGYLRRKRTRLRKEYGQESFF